jgi:DNA-binding MarR family transcriptional regulator
MPPTPSPGDLTAADVADLLGPLQRALRRRVREDWPLEPLPAAQVDLLRAVRMRPGATVGEIATELRVAPNTASTLVQRLVAAGLVEREADASDRRAMRLRLTPAAHARIDAWRARRQEVLDRALAGLRDADRDGLRAALPALRALLAELEG